MLLKIIKTSDQYDQAIEELRRLLTLAPPKGTEDADKIELVALLIEDYEKRTFEYINELPDPIEAIKFCMEQQGLKQKDLIEYMGSASKVSEVFNRKRSLTMPMIRKLSKALDIPAEILIQDSQIQSPEPNSNYACA